MGGEGRSCLAFSVLKSEPTAGGRDPTGVKDTLLGVGPLGLVVLLGVVDPGVLALLMTLGFEGVRGVVCCLVFEELVGVRGELRAWGVDGALVFPDVGV